MAEFLNKNIKFLRTQKGISQQNLADKIGIDRSTISRIENNEIETTVDNAIKIADVLNVPFSDLINKDLQNEKNDNADIRLSQFRLLYDKMKDLPEESQKIVYNVTKSIMDEMDNKLDNKE